MKNNNIFKIVLFSFFICSFLFTLKHRDKMKNWEYLEKEEQEYSQGCYDTVVYFGKTFELCDYELLEYWDQIGIIKEYYEDGELLWEQSWVGPIRLGLWTKYYKNGKKWYEGHYNEGKKVGDWTEWHPDGRVKQLETYISVNNSILTKFAYHDNYQISITQEYKVYQNNYDDDYGNYTRQETKHGERIYYDREGNLIKKENWENGKLVETKEK